MDAIKKRWKKIEGGIHITSEGVLIKKGDVIQTSEDLSLYGSFECLDKATDSFDSGMQPILEPLPGEKWNLKNGISGKVLNELPLGRRSAELFLPKDGTLPEFVEEPMKDVGNLDLPLPESNSFNVSEKGEFDD